MRHYGNSLEDQTKRRERALLCRSQRPDPLRERERIIRFWKLCAETNKGYLPHNGAWWSSFRLRQFRHLCMPRLRALLDARDRAWGEAYTAELRASAKRWAQVKAERAAAKRRAAAPQTEIFAAEGMAA